MIPPWNGIRSLILSAKLPEVDFLPFIPQPVTEYSTIYTSMLNFAKVSKQLDYEAMLVKSCSSLELLKSHSGSCKLNFVWFYELSLTKFYIQGFKLITVNKQNIGFSTRKVLNVRYFYVLSKHLGGLLFMKFNVTENIKYCLGHFICLLIRIYTYSSAWNLIAMSKQTEKLIIWVTLVADVYVQC